MKNKEIQTKATEKANEKSAPEARTGQRRSRLAKYAPLIAGIATALALYGCSDDTKKNTDAGVQCAFVSNDGGANQCLPADKCESKMVVSDGGSAVPVCVAKPQSDAGLDLDAKHEEDVKIDLDAKTEDKDSGASGPKCVVTTKARAYVLLGSSWEVAGLQCPKNGSQSKIDDSDTLRLKTGTSFSTCQAKADGTNHVVTLTCDNGVSFSSEAGVGCGKTASGGTEACSDNERIDVTSIGWTTANQNLGSKAIVMLSGPGKSQAIALKDNGTTVASVDLGLPGAPVKAYLKSLGQGNDGNVVISGTTSGPASEATCGTVVGSSGAKVGNVNVGVVATENDVRSDSQFSADFQGFSNVQEGGNLVIGPYTVNVAAVVAPSAVLLADKDANGQDRTCAVRAGLDTLQSCGLTYDGQAITLNTANMTPCVEPSSAVPKAKDAKPK
jgi:hypothetical protein